MIGADANTREVATPARGADFPGPALVFRQKSRGNASAQKRTRPRDQLSSALFWGPDRPKSHRRREADVVAVIGDADHQLVGCVGDDAITVALVQTFGLAILFDGALVVARG